MITFFIAWLKFLYGEAFGKASLRSGITSGLWLCIRPYRYASQLVRRQYQFWAFDWRNLNKYKRSFLFKSPSFSSYSFISHTAKLEMFTYSYLIANIQSFTSQILGVVGILGENLYLFSLLGFDVQTKFWSQSPKNKLFTRLSEWGKSDAWSINGNDFKI